MNDKTTIDSAPAKGGDAPPVITESFADMLDASLGTATRFEGSVVPGKVLSVQNDMVLIDVGLKVEGWVALKEFGAEPPGVGDEVEVFIDRIENRRGEAGLSREKARREEAWTMLEKAFENAERVTGVIFGRVKGGFTVDINGAFAFLPAARSTSVRCATSHRCSTPISLSRFSRWTAAGATSWCRVARCSRIPAPSSAPS